MLTFDRKHKYYLYHGDGHTYFYAAIVAEKLSIYKRGKKLEYRDVISLINKNKIYHALGDNKRKGKYLIPEWSYFYYKILGKKPNCHNHITNKNEKICYRLMNLKYKLKRSQENYIEENRYFFKDSDFLFYADKIKMKECIFDIEKFEVLVSDLPSIFADGKKIEDPLF